MNQFLITSDGVSILAPLEAIRCNQIILYLTVIGWRRAQSRLEPPPLEMHVSVMYYMRAICNQSFFHAIEPLTPPNNITQHLIATQHYSWK